MIRLADQGLCRSPQHVTLAQAYVHCVLFYHIEDFKAIVSHLRLIQISSLDDAQ